MGKIPDKFFKQIYAHLKQKIDSKVFFLSDTIILWLCNPLFWLIQYLMYLFMSWNIHLPVPTISNACVSKRITSSVLQWTNVLLMHNSPGKQKYYFSLWHNMSILKIKLKNTREKHCYYCYIIINLHLIKQIYYKNKIWIKFY